jgi:phytanoyl-CoA hydroxylase
MTDPLRLTKTFHEHGYVAVPSFLASEDLQSLNEHLTRYLRDIVPRMSAEHVFYEDKQHRSSLKQLQRMHEYDDWFMALFTDGRFRETAESLLAGPVVPKNLQYFNKPPRFGQPTPPHQDGYYFMISPCEAVTMWLALDDVDEQNGCVRYVPGSHRRGMRTHGRTTTLGFSQGIVDYPTEDDRLRETPISARPGDLLVHHALTIHRADGNHGATRHRRALGFIYYSARAREDSQAHLDYQRRLAEELRAAGKL